jgi:hypothetical protein
MGVIERQKLIQRIYIHEELLQMHLAPWQRASLSCVLSTSWIYLVNPFQASHYWKHLLSDAWVYPNIDDALQQNAEMHHKFYQTTAMALCSLRIQYVEYTSVRYQQSGPTRQPHLTAAIPTCTTTRLSLIFLASSAPVSALLVLADREVAVQCTQILSFTVKNCANLVTIRLQHLISTLFMLMHENELPCGLMPTVLLKA